MIKRAGLILYFWLTAGSVIGTLVLKGPVQWVMALGRNLGWAPLVENSVGVLIIILVVAGSLWAAVALVARLGRASQRGVTAGAMGAAAILLAGCLTLWLNPGAGGAAVLPIPRNARVVCGPYPTRPVFEQLRGMHFKTVISLLHPSVIPFEPKLMAEEDDLAREFGIRLVQAPMLPWVSANRESLNKVVDTLRNERGRIYIHCYLGKDRVNVVSRYLKAVGMDVTPVGIESPRSLAAAGKFERGPLVPAGDGITITPYPTDQEFLTFILSGGIAGVVSLLDPGRAEDRKWIDKEEALLSEYKMDYRLIPIPSSTPSPASIREAAQRIRAVPVRPLVVHAFRSDTPKIRALAEALRSQKP